jgi:hypothetical protein
MLSKISSSNATQFNGIVCSTVFTRSASTMTGILRVIYASTFPSLQVLLNLSGKTIFSIFGWRATDCHRATHISSVMGTELKSNNTRPSFSARASTKTSLSSSLLCGRGMRVVTLLLPHRGSARRRVSIQQWDNSVGPRFCRMHSKRISSPNSVGLQLESSIWRSVLVKASIARRTFRLRLCTKKCEKAARPDTGKQSAIEYFPRTTSRDSQVVKS